MHPVVPSLIERMSRAHHPRGRQRGTFGCEQELTLRVREANRAHIASVAAQRRASHADVSARLRAHMLSSAVAAEAKEKLPVRLSPAPLSTAPLRPQLSGQLPPCQPPLQLSLPTPSVQSPAPSPSSWSSALSAPLHPLEPCATSPHASKLTVAARVRELCRAHTTSTAATAVITTAKEELQVARGGGVDGGLDSGIAELSALPHELLTTVALHLLPAGGIFDTPEAWRATLNLAGASKGMRAAVLDAIHLQMRNVIPDHLTSPAQLGSRIGDRSNWRQLRHQYARAARDR